MKTKKVDDLTTDELNEQVALCLGYGIKNIWVNWYTDKSGVAFMLCSEFDPCHNAKQAFEVIDREKISINYEYNLVVATKANQVHSLSTASTALISAMRCFVKSVKGEEVEL